jgi:tRNA A-37 threonylcarbamoyl transferase component Bud32/tetratricopeptide (TPR) repeat protein
VQTLESLTRICPHCGSSCAPEHQYCPACGFPVGTLGAATGGDKFIGKTLPGGHHILDLISVGGMGRVYRAQQSALGRTVAVKIIHPHLLADENSALRFMTEARAASQLNHPNSVSVFDFGRTEDGQPYLVMEFLRGKDLARVAYEDGPLPFGRVVDVLRQVLAALGEAHDLGIVHRDLKPENVILEPLRRGGDFVKVVDFGLAKLKADTQTKSVTSPGIVCGTPDYMAPEQGRGDAIDGRSDLYSVGVILFQLLTGRLPFEADSPTQVVMMHLTIPVPDPRQVAPERIIPEPLVAVVFRAMSKDSRDRYQDAAEFAEALRSALSVIQSSPPSAAAWEQRLSVPPVGVVSCPACGLVVALTKFCGECGARLTQRSGPLEGTTAPLFPLQLVGRDDDFAWLEERREAARGRLVAARLVGEPGAGKTRLLTELSRWAEADGDLVITAGPDPHLAEVPHHALRHVILKLSGQTEDQLSASGMLGTTQSVTEGLREVFGEVPRDDGRPPLQRRRARADALRWALDLGVGRAASGRVLLAIDELQRIDAPSRTAFADLVGEPKLASVLVLAAHSPGFDPGWSTEAGARLIAGLPFGAVINILKAHPSGERVRIDESARGYLPLYVEQVLRYSLEGGSDPPHRLADLIALRVDTLAPSARRALQVLGVVGDGVGPRVLAEMLQTEEGLDDALADLERANMIERTPVGGFMTAHPLVRDIVLAGIPAAVRRELHRRALVAGEVLRTPLEARAQHAYYAHDSFQALLLLEQVADRAALRGDPDTEVLALRRGLEMAREEISRGELDDPLRAMLIFSRKLGASLARTGNYADAEGVLREALDLAGPSGTDRARVLSSLAQVAHGRQRSKEALGYIDQAIDLANQLGATDLLASFRDTKRHWVA